MTVKTGRKTYDFIHIILNAFFYACEVSFKPDVVPTIQYAISDAALETQIHLHLLLSATPTSQHPINNLCKEPKSPPYSFSFR